MLYMKYIEMKLKKQKYLIIKKMNQKSMIFAVCFLVVAIQISPGHAGEDLFQSILPPKMKKMCNYTVRIHTTCTKGADTSNHISLRFGDTNSNDVLVPHLNMKHMRQVDPLQPANIDDVPKKPFQSCSVDEFEVTGPCVESAICYLYLKSRGNDDWRPGYAQVRVSRGLDFSSKDFYFRRYLPRHVWHGSDMCNDTWVSPFGIKHGRKVFSKENLFKPQP